MCSSCVCKWGLFVNRQSLQLDTLPKLKKKNSFCCILLTLGGQNVTESTCRLCDVLEYMFIWDKNPCCWGLNGHLNTISLFHKYLSINVALNFIFYIRLKKIYMFLSQLVFGKWPGCQGLLFFFFALTIFCGDFWGKQHEMKKKLNFFFFFF